MREPDAASTALIVAQHGRHVQSAAVLQPGMRVFRVDGTDAFIAWTSGFGTAIVLGDPVGSTDDVATVVDAFVASYSNAVFFQTSAAFSSMLRSRHNYRATPIGIEPTIDLASWQPRGRRKQAIRTARNSARARGIVVVEDNAFDVHSVGDAWLRTRRRRTLRFLVPPIDHRPLGARTFVAMDGDEPLGFVTFDALRVDGVVVGYTPSVSLASARFRQGLWYVVVAAAIDVFRAEGVNHLNLGLAPLAKETFNVEIAGHVSDAPLLRLAFRVLRDIGGAIYNFKGIEHAKGRFDGAPSLSWLCHRGRLPWWPLLAVLWRSFTGPR